MKRKVYRVSHFQGSVTLISLQGDGIAHRGLTNVELRYMNDTGSVDTTQVFRVDKVRSVPLFTTVRCEVICSRGMIDVLAVKIGEESKSAKAKTQIETYQICETPLDAVEIVETERAKYGNG